MKIHDSALESIYRLGGTSVYLKYIPVLHTGAFPA
jgi:hypothetical protein